MAPDSEPTPRVPWLPVNEGAQAATPTPPEPLTPSKPPVPAWIQRADVPSPVEDEDDDTDATVVSPVSPPPADEVLPRPGVETTSQEPDAAAPLSDPVHRLAESAVASAALSAGGAPTPLGGVPTVPADEGMAVPAFGDAAPLFTPRFLSGGDASADDQPNGDRVRDEQERLAAQASALDGGVAYEPRAFAVEAEAETEVVPALPPRLDPEATAVLPLVPEPAATLPVVPAEPFESELPPIAPIPDDDEEPPRGRRKWWIWVLLAVILAAGAVTTYLLLNPPEPLVVPGATITQPPPSPTIDPLPAPTGTDFQAAMPTTVGTYALVEATPLDPTDVALGAGRIADGVDLTYRSGTDTMTVRALQYFNEADATQMFTQFAGEGTATQPVEAGEVTVGESAVITSPEPGMVWRNGTSVFILTGPPTQIADFYAQFGL